MDKEIQEIMEYLAQAGYIEEEQENYTIDETTGSTPSYLNTLSVMASLENLADDLAYYNLDEEAKEIEDLIKTINKEDNQEYDNEFPLNGKMGLTVVDNGNAGSFQGMSDYYTSTQDGFTTRK